MFQLKYEVMRLEQHHRHIQASIGQTKESIHILKAEWAHLNDPSRLNRLCAQFLAISPIKGSQIIAVRQVQEEAGREESRSDSPHYDQQGLEHLIAALGAGTVAADADE